MIKFAYIAQAVLVARLGQLYVAIPLRQVRPSIHLDLLSTAL